MSDSPPVERFWEGFFDTRLRPGIQVVPHAALAGYAGVWFFVRGDAVVVSAPAGWCGRLEAELGRSTIDSLLSEDGLRGLFADAFDRSIGPSWLGWLPPDAFRPVESDAVRPATDVEFAALQAACPADAVEAAGLRADSAFGWFEDGEILAAASATAWGEGAVGPGVLSRRAGCGKAVVSAVCAAALGEDRLVVYQTLQQNERAVGLARGLGFGFYASHVAVRLRESPA